ENCRHTRAGPCPLISSTMKHCLFTLLAFLTAATLAQAVPQVTIDQAAALAQKDLKDRGLDSKIYVQSLHLDREAIVSKGLHWTAIWSEGIPGENRKKEVGMRINMDGTTVHLVEGPGSAEALRNPMTRADRPSIVDL